MKIQDIITDYGLNEEAARYLSHVSESKSWQVYEKHRRALQELCSSSVEREKATKCLTAVMKIQNGYVR